MDHKWRRAEGYAKKKKDTPNLLFPRPFGIAGNNLDLVRLDGILIKLEVGVLNNEGPHIVTESIRM